jgi:hypothetical protein
MISRILAAPALGAVAVAAMLAATATSTEAFTLSGPSVEKSVTGADIDHVYYRGGGYHYSYHGGSFHGGGYHYGYHGGGYHGGVYRYGGGGGRGCIRGPNGNWVCS